MDIVQPPTDNLYKFVAITGLLLVAASCYLPESYEYQFHLAEREGMKETADAVYEYERIVMLAGGFEAFQKAQKAKGDGSAYVVTDDEGERSQWESTFHSETETLLQMSVFPQASNPTDRLFWIEELGVGKDRFDKAVERHTSGDTNNEVDQLVSAAAMLRPKLLRAQLEVHKLWDMMDSLKQRRKLGGRGVAVGLVLAIGGFVAWYFRVQRHQDAVLRNEVKKSAV